MSYTLITWNTLHIYHEEKYVPESNIMKSFPDESDRINTMINQLKSLLDNRTKMIACLQEVSGDLLEKIYVNFSDKYKIYEFEHNRIPTHVSTEKYTSPKEYLITLISKDIYETGVDIAKLQFEKEGKAMLAVVFNNNLIVINTHLPIAIERDELILSIMNKFVKTYEEEKIVKNIIICGDFNDTLQRSLKALYDDGHYDKISCFIDFDNRTDLYSIPSKKRWIDYLIGLGHIRFTSHKVIDVKNASDHNIVLGNFVIDEHISDDDVCNRRKEKYLKKILLLKDRDVKGYRWKSFTLTKDGIDITILRFVSISEEQINVVNGLGCDKIKTLFTDEHKDKLSISDLLRLKTSIEALVVPMFKTDKLFEIFSSKDIIVTKDKKTIPESEYKDILIDLSDVEKTFSCT